MRASEKEDAGRRGCAVKFAFLVSGPALSEGQIEALRHSIEDLAQQYGMDKFAVPFVVERVPDYLAFPLEGQTARLPGPLGHFPAVCPACGVTVKTASEGALHLVDGCQKSAPGRLKRLRDLMGWTPLDLVVFGPLCFAFGFLVRMMLKP